MTRLTNLSPIDSPLVDQSYGLSELEIMLSQVDTLVVTLPLTPQTTSLVDTKALMAMRRSAILVHVGRGSVVDEQALFEALAAEHIGGAILDTWYQYPSP